MRFLQNLFSVPKGKKVTDADMKRVLVSSVCGILVCMTCLISSTWAWYTVSAETGPVSIEVAELELTVGVDGVQTATEDTFVALMDNQQSTVQLKIDPEQQADSLKTVAKRYVVLSVYDAEEQHVSTYYVPYNGSVLELTLATDLACKVYFTPTWQIPLQGEPLPEEVFKLIPAPVETTATTTAATTEATTETTTAPTGVTTAPTTEVITPVITPVEDKVPGATTIPSDTGVEFS